MPLDLFVSRRAAREIERVVQWWAVNRTAAPCAKTFRLLSTFCSCTRTLELASRRRVYRTCGDCTLIESDTGFTTVSNEIASKSYRCGIQVAAAVYPLLADAKAKRDGFVRVIDESGEDYLYPESNFVAIDIPSKAREALSAAS